MRIHYSKYHAPADYAQLFTCRTITCAALTYVFCNKVHTDSVADTIACIIYYRCTTYANPSHANKPTPCIRHYIYCI